jgi:hypothetical protein
MLTYVAPKGRALDFDGDTLTALGGKPEQTRAIVRLANGQFTVASYSYRRFGDGAAWCVWSDVEYRSQFATMIDLGLAKQFPQGRGWVIEREVQYVWVA